MENIILPYKVNVLHYFAYQNNSEGLGIALSNRALYFRDKLMKRTPLEYAMERRSFECTELLLEYIMQLENIYTTLTEKEISDIIEFSPANLKNFF